MKIHEFDPVIYPRKLWVAVSTDTFSDRFEGVSEWDDTADAIVDCVRDKQRNLGGILVRYESKNAITIANIAHESSHIAMQKWIWPIRKHSRILLDGLLTVSIR